MKIMNKYETYDMRNALKLWRINSGLAIKQYNNHGKTLLLAKAISKAGQKSMNYLKLQCYQKWKEMSFKNQGANPKDRMMSILSEMIT